MVPLLFLFTFLINFNFFKDRVLLHIPGQPEAHNPPVLPSGVPGLQSELLCLAKLWSEERSLTRVAMCRMYWGIFLEDGYWVLGHDVMCILSCGLGLERKTAWMSLLQRHLKEQGLSRAGEELTPVRRTLNQSFSPALAKDFPGWFHVLDPKSCSRGIQLQAEVKIKSTSLVSCTAC